MKQKKSIKPLKVLFNYIFPIFGPNFGKQSQWVGGIVSAVPMFALANATGPSPSCPQQNDLAHVHPWRDVRNSPFGSEGPINGGPGSNGGFNGGKWGKII